MSKKNGNAPRWHIEVCSNARIESPFNADEHEREYEQVGEKLVHAAFIEELLDEVNGKEIASPLVMSISELIDDDFLHCHTECQHAVMAECLMMLFDTTTIVVRDNV